MEDRELLEQFVADRDEQAFTELVRRHIDLVYAAARRQLSDSAAADDITQAVFVLLAQKARTIRKSETLPGWLLVTTRFVTINTIRSEVRRRRHEREAASMKQEADEQAESCQQLWTAIGPLLDEAIAGLKPSDRDALVMRYFQNRSLSDVAVTLGVSQVAAQKRVHRAIERLRTIFAIRGITASPELLGLVLANNALMHAPQALLETIPRAARSAAQMTSAATIAKGAVILMATTKTKLAVGSAVIILLAGIGGGVAYRTLQQLTLPSGQIAAPTTAPFPAWRPPFDKVYAIQSDEIVRHIMPPFIRERRDYENTKGFDATDGSPNTFVLEWDGANYRMKSGYFAQPDLAFVLENVADIYPQNVDISRELLFRPVPGDWVFRSEASSLAKVTAISRLIGDTIGTGMELTPIMVEREAIVVRGEFKYVPMPGIQPARPDDVHFFRGEPVARGAGRYAGSSDAVTMLQNLGAVLVRPMVIETEITSKVAFSWQAHKSANFRSSVEPPDGAIVDEILANVTRQTSLEFKRERRFVLTWRLVKSGS